MSQPAAFKFTCPRCGAKPGVRCLSLRTGQPLNSDVNMHGPRTDLLRAAKKQPKPHPGQGMLPRTKGRQHQ